MDAINLLLLRTGEWLEELSSFGRAMLGIAIVVLLAVAAHLLMHEGEEYDPSKVCGSRAG